MRIRISGYEIASNEELYNVTLEYLNKIYYGVYGNIPYEDILINTKPNVESAVSHVTSILSQIRYDPDHIISLDYPQSADITIHREAGDCEDFARLACCLLAQFGVKSKIIIMYRPDESGFLNGHAVCATTIGGQAIVFDINSMTVSSRIESCLQKYSNYTIFLQYDFNPKNPILQRVVANEVKELTPVSGVYDVYSYSINPFSFIRENKTVQYVILGIIIAVILLGVIS